MVLRDFVRARHTLPVFEMIVTTFRLVYLVTRTYHVYDEYIIPCSLTE